jgi:hypothetical protein
VNYLVITGGSAGIGAATALRFREAGWQVINLSRRPCPVPDVTQIDCDLAAPDFIDRIAGRLGGHLADADRVAMIHNAARMDHDSAADTESSALRAVLEINLVAPNALNRFTIPHMKPGSAILYVGSTLSEKAVPRSYSYVVSKHAMIGMMRATCQDLAGTGDPHRLRLPRIHRHRDAARPRPRRGDAGGAGHVGLRPAHRAARDRRSPVLDRRQPGHQRRRHPRQPRPGRALMSTASPVAAAPEEIDAATLTERRERVFLVLAGFFICAMTLLNVVGITRFVQLGPMALAVGVLPYPLTFLCTDLISELYGRRRANFLVWVGFTLNFFILGMLWLGNAIPAVDPEQQPPWQVIQLAEDIMLPNGEVDPAASSSFTCCTPAPRARCSPR